MATPQADEQVSGNEKAGTKPDAETLNTTDPQEHMEGPISSLMQNTEESFENEETADKDDTRNS